MEAASDGVAEPCHTRCFSRSQSLSLGCSVDVLPRGGGSSEEHVEAEVRGTVLELCLASQHLCHFPPGDREHTQTPWVSGPHPHVGVLLVPAL